jgi:hypothetical protein
MEEYPLKNFREESTWQWPPGAKKYFFLKLSVSYTKNFRQVWGFNRLFHRNLSFHKASTSYPQTLFPAEKATF